MVGIQTGPVKANVVNGDAVGDWSVKEGPCPPMRQDDFLNYLVPGFTIPRRRSRLCPVPAGIGELNSRKEMFRCLLAGVHGKILEPIALRGNTS